MNKERKTVITFALATLTPTLVWIVFVPLILLIMVLRNPTVPLSEVNLRSQIFQFLFATTLVFFWLYFFAIFVFAVSVMHMLVLGVPAFLVAGRFTLIRWYTVLTASFFIGSAPSLFFMWGAPKDMLIGIPMTLGVFGFSAGLVFWILWRFWVSPEDYIKKTSSIAPHAP